MQLADLCPEYSSLRKLMKRGVGGLSFPSQAGERMESRLPGLLSDSSRERLRTALDVLTELSEVEAAALATPQKSAPITADESAQLNRILDFLHKRFAGPIRVEDVCGVETCPSDRYTGYLFDILARILQTTWDG